MITAHNSSCEKVMFLQACVKNSVHGAITGHMTPPAPWADTLKVDTPIWADPPPPR